MKSLPSTRRLAIRSILFTPLALWVPLFWRRREKTSKACLASLCGCWVAGQSLLLWNAIPWKWGWGLQILFSAAMGAVGGFLISDTAPAPAIEKIPAVNRAYRCITVIAIFYAIGLTSCGVFSMLKQIGHPEVTDLLDPSILLYSIPFAFVGALYSWLWQCRGRTGWGQRMLYAVLGIHGLVAAQIVVNLILIGIFYSFTYTFNFQTELDWTMWAIGAIGAALIVYFGYDFSLCSSGRQWMRHFGSNLLLLTLHGFTVWMGYGWYGEFFRQHGIENLCSVHERDVSNGIEQLQKYLRIHASNQNRADVLWQVGTSQTLLGHAAEAKESFRQLAALSDDEPGQNYVRFAKAVLAYQGVSKSSEAVRILPMAPIEPEDYLDANWRSLLSFWRAGDLNSSLEEFLGCLRVLSQSDQKIRLPKVNVLFAAQGFSGFLKRPVRFQRAQLADLRSILATGQPILLEELGRLICLTGYDAARGTFFYLDYANEPSWLKKRQEALKARTVLHSRQTESSDAARSYQRALTAAVPEEEVGYWLRQNAAWIAVPMGKQTVASEAGAAPFLLGQAAFDKKDDALALSYYYEAWKQSGEAAWVLPFGYAALWALERPPFDLKEALFPMPKDYSQSLEKSTETGMRRWKEILLKWAQTTPLKEWPEKILWNVGGLYDEQDAGERAQAVLYFEQILRTKPDEMDIIRRLQPLYKRDGQWAPFLDLSRRLFAETPAGLFSSKSTKGQLSATEDYRLDVIEGLVRTGQVPEAERFIRRTNAWQTPFRQRYWGLLAQMANVEKKYSKAERLLRRCFQSLQQDPELHYDYAIALEGLGRQREASYEWRWVEKVSVNPTSIALARERLKSQVNP
jgi:hypothetical protein